MKLQRKGFVEDLYQKYTKKSSILDKNNFLFWIRKINIK